MYVARGFVYVSGGDRVSLCGVGDNVDKARVDLLYIASIHYPFSGEVSDIEVKHIDEVWDNG